MTNHEEPDKAQPTVEADNQSSQTSSVAPKQAAPVASERIAQTASEQVDSDTNSQNASAVPESAAPEESEQDAAAGDQTPTQEEIEAARRAADAAVLSNSRKHTRRSFVVATVGAAAGYGFYRWIDGSPADLRQPIPLRRALQSNAAVSRAIFDERALAPTYPLSRAEVLRVNGVYGLKQALVPDSWRLQLVGTRDPQSHPRFSRDVTAWEYRYEASNTNEDKGHDTKVAPGSDTAEKMPPEPMVEQEKRREQRTVRMPRGTEEAGQSHSTLAPGTSGLLLTLDDVLELPRHEFVTQFKCIEGWSQIVHWAGVRLADFMNA